MNPTAKRSGVALLWALVVLSVLSVVTTTATWQFMAARRNLEARQFKLQARWLARSAAELAAARLLADPDGYAGEVVELIPNAQVKVAVEKIPDKPGTFRIECQVRYPTTGPQSIGMTTVKIATRRTEGTKVRIELANASDPDGEGGSE